MNCKVSVMETAQTRVLEFWQNYLAPPQRPTHLSRVIWLRHTDPVSSVTEKSTEVTSLREEFSGGVYLS